MVKSVFNWLSCWGIGLDQDVHTPLHSHHIVTGAHCVVSTNSQAILEAAQSFFRQAAEPLSPPTLSLRFWVDPTAQSSPPWPQPFFRGLGHLAYAGFDSENSLLLDLRRRSVLGRFSPAMAQDADYWQRVIFPTVVGLASDALGVTVIHSACVERNGAGLLLAGESGAGKSTLSLAMAQCGFAFLSDDRTYLSHAGGQLIAWGLITPLKLLPHAAKYFPELRSREPGVSLNGERAYEVDPEQVFGVRRSLRCEPRWLVFLERQDKPQGTPSSGCRPKQPRCGWGLLWNDCRVSCRGSAKHKRQPFGVWWSASAGSFGMVKIRGPLPRHPTDSAQSLGPRCGGVSLPSTGHFLCEEQQV